MKLQEKINQDLKAAMLQKDEDKKSLIRVMIGEFNRVPGSKDLTDEQVVKILKKMRENAVELNNQVEINILDEYLPKELSKEELIDIINQIVSENAITSIKEMGKVMGLLKGKNIPYDGKLASEIVKSILK